MTNEYEDKEKREGEVNGHGVEMVFMGLHVKPTAFNENNIQEISSRILKIYWLDFSTGEEAIKFPFFGSSAAWSIGHSLKLLDVQ